MDLRLMFAVPTLLCLIGIATHAQTPRSHPPTEPAAGTAVQGQPTPSPARPPEAPEPQELTLSGCLMRHAEVPAPTNRPSLDPAVKHDGFILVDASIVPHHKGVNGMRPAVSTTNAAHAHSDADARPAASGPSNAGDSQMFRIEGLPALELEPFAGKRVTLMGGLVAVDRQGGATTVGKDSAHDAAPFKATMIHPSSEPCRQ